MPPTGFIRQYGRAQLAAPPPQASGSVPAAPSVSQPEVQIPNPEPARHPLEDHPRSEEFSRRQVHIALSQPLNTPSFTLGRQSTLRPSFLKPWVTDGSSWVEREKNFPTEAIFQWFECEPNDFNVKDYQTGSAVKFQWTGSAGSSPRDYRARPFGLRWAEGSDAVSPSEQRAAAKQRLPVARAWFLCAGKHTIVEKAPRRKPGEPKLAGPKRGHECTGDKGENVKVLVEIYADDFTRAWIYQSGDHPKTVDTRWLQMSRRLRNLIEDRYANHGTTHSAKVTEIQRDLLGNFGKSQRLPDYPFPAHRIPSEKNLKAMFTPGRMRHRYDRDPFISMHIITLKMPDKVFNYVPFDARVSPKNSEFCCSFKDDTTLDSLIINAPDRGVAMDSSHRNKNENRAPFTLLMTVNEAGHLTPGAANLSAKANEKAFVQFLQGVSDEIMKRATKIVADLERDPNMSIYGSDPAERAKLLAQAKKIVKEGFKPSHWMSDKCFAQIRAILEVFPAAVIRICQFHVVQAILRWDTDPGVKKSASPKIPLTLKFRMLVALRIFQRVRTWAELHEAKKTLLQRLRRLVYGLPPGFETSKQDLDELEELGKKTAEGGDFDYDTWWKPDADELDASLEEEEGEDTSAKWDDVDPEFPNFVPTASQLKQWLFVKKYFLKNWLVDWLIPMWTDIGLPPEGTRDGTWNVNNWVERAFRIIDEVFLDCRRNKRIDRLALIIVLEFFVFYAVWRNNTLNHRPNHLFAANYVGYYLWDKACVERIQGRIYRVYSCKEIDDLHKDILSRTTKDRPRNAPSPASPEIIYIIDLDKFARCKCADHVFSGKACGHLQAARIFDAVGTVREFQEIECNGTTFTDSKNSGHMRSDKAYALDFEKVMELLRRAAFSAPKPKLVLPPGLQPLASNGPTRARIVFTDDNPQMRRALPPPPDAIQALFPYRSQTNRDIVRFQEPAGRRTVAHMYNSCLPPSARTHTIDPNNLLPPGAILHDPTAQAAAAAKAVSSRSRIADEDTLIFSTKCIRWVEDDCTLEPDEMNLFMELWNSCSALLGRKIVFFDAAIAAEAAEILAMLDWSAQPKDVREEDQLLRGIADQGTRDTVQASLVWKLLWAHRELPLERIVFLNMQQGCWSFVVHTLTSASSDSVRAVCTHGHVVDYDIQHQITFQRFFRDDQPALQRLTTPCTTYPNDAVRLILKDHWSGFWAAFFCTGLLLGTAVDDPRMVHISMNDAKRNLRQIFVGYVASAEGLSSKTLEAAFGAYVDDPSIFGRQVESSAVIAPAPEGRGPDLEFVEFEQHRKYLEFGVKVLDAVRPQDHVMVDGRPVSVAALQACTHSHGPLAPGLFDEALRIFMSNRGLPDGTGAWRIGKTIVLSVHRAAEILAAAVQRRECAKPPSGTTWFEHDIFAGGGSRIIIPFYKVRKGKGKEVLDDWDVAEVDLALQDITIYSPRDPKDNTRWKHLMGRLVKFVRSDYQAREKTEELDKIWKLADVTRTERPKRAAQSASPEDDSFYAFEFVRQLAQGVAPWPENWNSTAFAAKNRRAIPLVLVGVRAYPEIAGALKISVPHTFGTSAPEAEAAPEVEVTEILDADADDSTADAEPSGKVSEEVMGRALETLAQPTAWLLDTCIQAWIKLLVSLKYGSHRWFVADSLFATRLRDPATFECACRWYKAVRMSDLGQLIMPVHFIARKHWAVVCVNFQAKRIELYDSLPRYASDDLYEVLMKFVARRLAQERKDDDSEPTTAGWADALYCPPDVPQQADGFNCGVYAAAFCEELINGRTPTLSGGFRFMPDDAAAYRSHMVDMLAEHFDVTFSGPSASATEEEQPPSWDNAGQTGRSPGVPKSPAGSAHPEASTSGSSSNVQAQQAKRLRLHYRGSDETDVPESKRAKLEHTAEANTGDQRSSNALKHPVETAPPVPHPTHHLPPIPSASSSTSIPPTMALAQPLPSTKATETASAPSIAPSSAEVAQSLPMLWSAPSIRSSIPLPLSTHGSPKTGPPSLPAPPRDDPADSTPVSENKPVPSVQGYGPLATTTALVYRRIAPASSSAVFPVTSALPTLALTPFRTEPVRLPAPLTGTTPARASVSNSTMSVFSLLTPPTFTSSATTQHLPTEAATTPSQRQVSPSSFSANPLPSPSARMSSLAPPSRVSTPLSLLSTPVKLSPQTISDSLARPDFEASSFQKWLGKSSRNRRNVPGMTSNASHRSSTLPPDPTHLVTNQARLTLPGPSSPAPGLSQHTSSADDMERAPKRPRLLYQEGHVVGGSTSTGDFPMFNVEEAGTTNTLGIDLGIGSSALRPKSDSSGSPDTRASVAHADLVAANGAEPPGPGADPAIQTDIKTGVQAPKLLSLIPRTNIRSWAPSALGQVAAAEQPHTDTTTGASSSSTTSSAATPAARRDRQDETVPPAPSKLDVPPFSGPQTEGSSSSAASTSTAGGPTRTNATPPSGAATRVPDSSVPQPTGSTRPSPTPTPITSGTEAPTETTADGHPVGGDEQPGGGSQVSGSDGSPSSPSPSSPSGSTESFAEENGPVPPPPQPEGWSLLGSRAKRTWQKSTKLTEGTSYKGGHWCT